MPLIKRTMYKKTPTGKWKKGRTVKENYPSASYSRMQRIKNYDKKDGADKIVIRKKATPMGYKATSYSVRKGNDKMIVRFPKARKTKKR